MSNLIVAVTGASGALAAKLLISRSPWPVTLIISTWGKRVYEQECGPVAGLTALVNEVYDINDLSAPVASGSVATEGMVVIPCTCNTLGEIASGRSANLISRAAHCHLKEQRRLVLCIREAPLSLIDIENCATVSRAGGIIMPLSPPFYMTANNETPGDKIPIDMVLNSYADRVFALLGASGHPTWEDKR